jgi:serine phosphatase RsbU (regulator of sigma subunit)
MELARRIHRSLLPQRLVSERIDIDVRYREMNLLGGDYATVHQREADLVFVCICDVVGHGLAAALLAARVNSFVRHAVVEVGQPCRVVTELNDFIFRNFGNFGVFVTFFCLAIDLRRREIEYAGCGHPPALLCNEGGTSCLRLLSQHEPIGVFPKLAQACQNDRVPIAAGDRILLYTDGIIEARNQAGALFGIEAVESVLASSDASVGSPQLLDATFAAMDEFRHGEQNDDALVVAARIK